MTDQMTMTMQVPGQPPTGPFTLEQLKAATSLVTDDLFIDVVRWVIVEQKISTGRIQRQFGIGFNRATRMVEQMEDMGIITTADHVGKREVVAKDLPEPLALAAAAQAKIRQGRAPMKETPADREVREAATTVAAEELRQFIERYERLEAEKADIVDGQKEIMAEAKGRGYDTKVIRKLIAMRKRDKDDLAEEEAILELYKSCLGM